MSLNDQFAEFERTPPPDLFGDPIWRLPAYRIALFLADISKEDLSFLRKRQCSPYVIGQLERAVHSIGVNIAEGYSRFSGRERARYYEIALGSAREAREWYRRSVPWLGEELAIQRAYLLTRAVKILTAAVPKERSGSSEDRIRGRAQSVTSASQSTGAGSGEERTPAPAPARTPASASSKE